MIVIVTGYREKGVIYYVTFTALRLTHCMYGSLRISSLGLGLVRVLRRASGSFALVVISCGNVSYINDSAETHCYATTHPCSDMYPPLAEGTFQCKLSLSFRIQPRHEFFKLEQDQ